MNKTWHYLSTVPIIIGLAMLLSSCFGGGGGGGGGVPGGGGGNPNATIIAGNVADGFVAGATVTAFQVNANGTQGAQIGTPVLTDQSGNYSLNLGTYTGLVLITSKGGTYTDTVTGGTIDLTNSTLILSAIVPNAAGTLTVQINPITTMAANVALTLMGQGTPAATAADAANASIQNYFGISLPILNTALVNLTAAGCMTGAQQASADASAILAGISQLAYNNGVSSLDLVQALIQDVTSDGQFNGMAGGATISLPLTSGTGTLLLSTIEGPSLSGLASAITSFMTSPTANICGASVTSGVISSLSNTNIFTTPASPTGVTAMAGAGFIRIRWDTTVRATSYNLYLATSPGVTAASTQLPGYMSIPNVTGPYDISTGLTSSTTYYFVVTAVSGTGPYVGSESAASAEVSAAFKNNTFPPQWAESVIAGSKQSEFSSVSTASDGSLYAAGFIVGTGTYGFGNGITTAGTYTHRNLVLVKYNSSAAAQWAQTVTAGSGDSEFYSVSTAVDGSVYAVGYITGTGTYNFGNSVTAVGTNSSSNLVLVKYNGSGVAQWAQTVTAGSGYSWFNSVSVASDGSVCAAGYITGIGAYNFGNSVTAASDGSDLVLVKYSSSGAAQWVQTVTSTAGSGVSNFQGVSVASDGSVYATGYIAGTGTYNFGNSVTATGTYSGYNSIVVKYSSAGAAQWAQTVTAGSNQSSFNSVSVAPDGSVYAAGYITGTGAYIFGNGVTALGTYASNNLVLVKYSSSGTALWAQTITAGSNQSSFNSVSVAPDGSVYAAGYITGTGTYNFGNAVTTAGTNRSFNLLLVTYDSAGAAQWAQSVTAGGSDSDFSGVSVAPDGSVYAAGFIAGTGAYNFGNSTTTTGTYTDGYNMALVKYNGFGSIAWSW